MTRTISNKLKKYIKESLDDFRGIKNGVIVLGAGGTKINNTSVPTLNSNNVNLASQNNTHFFKLTGSLINYNITGNPMVPMTSYLSGAFVTTGMGSYHQFKPQSPIELLPEWLKIAYDKNGPIRIVIDAAINEGLNHQQIVEKASHFFYRAYAEKGYMEKEEYKVNPLLQAQNSGVKPEIQGYKVNTLIIDEMESFKNEYLASFYDKQDKSLIGAAKRKLALYDEDEKYNVDIKDSLALSLNALYGSGNSGTNKK